MAAVYQAYHAAMERYVALKILPRHYAGDPRLVVRFRQEAKLLAQLQHPHILPVFDFGEADGYSYLVMPYLRSGTLTTCSKASRSACLRFGLSSPSSATRSTTRTRAAWSTAT